MPYDSAGNFSLVPSYKATSGQTIRTEQHNPPLEDIASALSSVLVRDGRNGMVGPLNMGSFPITHIEASQTATNAATVGQVQGAAPIGVLADFAGSTAPAGWLLCYGQAISRSTYAALFSVIGSTYGAGDGSTTFNVPDFRGRVAAGRDNMGGTNADRLTGYAAATVLGGDLGSSLVTLTAAQLPANIPNSLAGLIASGLLDVPVITNYIINSATGSSTAGYVYGATTSRPSFTGSVSGTLSINSSGGGAHPNAQPTLIVNKIIKATY